MRIRKLILAGVLTWVIVALPHVRDVQPLWAVCSVAFLVLFLIAAPKAPGRSNLLFVLPQSALALICCYLVPNGMQPVLLVLVAAQLGDWPPAVGISFVVLQSALLPIALVHSSHLVGWNILGYFAFQLFGFLTARIAFEERNARQALAEAHADLRVATGLLDISSRAEERLRIARDLHDLIGHHLTALTLNLEVASHLADEPAKAQIEKSKSIAKLLLSDVRDVVSRLRDQEPVDLAGALASMRDAVPQPSIHIETNGGAIARPHVAETALRAVQEIVTNAVRHSNARNLWLQIETVDNMLTVDAHDDGGGTDRVVFGNGLRGMRERVQQAGGSLQVASTRGRGFEVRVRLPLEGPA
ncbi:MAG: sensor histidine kinase [Acidobacteriota bacterium]|nr:sensor histidine kinase [Acidobacteriota bacterium]